MNAADPELIQDVIALTGCPAPAWLASDAPVLQSADAGTVYLIGVIGGKDVGKSSLINALIGTPLARVTAHGEGTARALAYVYRDDAQVAEQLLTTVIPEQFDVVLHDSVDGRGRVLLDLPDIDSIYADHVDLTRRLLRHLLYPIWVQSIEKYADREPLQLLARVAEGNAPENFLFVLTKADQLTRRHGDAALGELADDYAKRVARACRQDAPMRVFAVNSLDAKSLDLPQLAGVVLAARSTQLVARSRDLARRQQQRTIIDWLTDQRIDERLQIAERQADDVQETIASRLTEPLVDQLSSRIANDSSLRSQIVEPIIRERLSYWPIINVIDSVLGPIVATAQSGAVSSRPDLVSGDDLAQRVKGVFATLAQRDPAVLDLYAHDKLWEQDAARRSAANLQQSLERAVEQQRASLAKSASKPSLFTRFLAPIITIGAAIWFPIAQPILEIVLSETTMEFSRKMLLKVIELLGASYLIKSVGFLVIYYFAIWMWLRWLAGRRVLRELRRSTDADHPAQQILLWSARLAEPARQKTELLKQLSDRVQAVQRGLPAAA